MPALAHRVTMPRPGDPHIIVRFTEAVRSGLPLSTCATMAGIGEQTARDWMKEGLEALDEAPDTPLAELSSHARFAWAVKEADAAMVADNVGVIEAGKAGPKGWLAAFTHLERLKPHEWGRFQRVEVEQRTLTVSITAQLPPGAAEALLAMARDEQTEGAKFLPPGPQDSDSA